MSEIQLPGESCRICRCGSHRRWRPLWWLPCDFRRKYRWRVSRVRDLLRLNPAACGRRLEPGVGDSLARQRRAYRLGRAGFGGRATLEYGSRS